ncbi:MAG: ABC transporter permease subunit [bacterium]|nr:ABC transporter permease subunit [bacterium]
MLATVVTKTFRDRWKGEAIGAVTLVLLFFMGMAVYRDIDLAVYTDLPEIFRSLMNIPSDADVGALAYGAIYTSYGAMTLTALAISMGSASIAGEERNGTMGLLLGNPKSRSHILVSKAVNILVLTALGCLLLWIGGLVVPSLLNVNVSGIHVGALMVHMFAIATFHGFLALALSAWTGKGVVATGTTVAVMIISFMAVGILPLIENLEAGAKLFPWYYFSGSQPHVNGASWGHLAVLFVGIAILAAVAVAGVNRRDLRGQTTGVSLVDRLRTHPLTEKLVDRLAGSTRVSRIWIKTASEHQGLLIIVSYAMFLVMGVMMGPMYTFIDETLVTLADAFPEGVLALFGGGDLATPEGWYQIETFGLMAPIAFMIITITLGAKALAGEEAQRTMGLLLANPIKRSRVILEKTVTMVVYTLVLAIALFSGVALGSMFGGLGISGANIAATVILGALLGLVFGGLALAISALTGTVRIAVFGSIGVGLVAFVANGFLPLSEGFEGLVKWTPVHYYLGSDPLNNGMNWGHGALLAALFVALIAVAVVLFDRRDLRQSG